jgi:hypothetical protein
MPICSSYKLLNNAKVMKISPDIGKISVCFCSAAGPTIIAPQLFKHSAMGK